MSGNNEIKLKNCVWRWEYIDLIEALGIFFVVLYHSTTYPFNWMDESNPLYFLRYYVRTILSTGVPLFFFANGYLLLNRKFDLKKHIKKSIRIVILTFSWGLINILCLMPIENEILSLKEIVVYLCEWHQGWINHLWYMGTLTGIYVFLPILKNVFDTNRKFFIFFTIMAAVFTFGNTAINIVGTLAIGYLRNIESVFTYNWFSMFNPFRGIYGYAFVYFCIGGIAHDFKDKINNIPELKRNLAASFCILFSCFILFFIGINLTKASGKIWDVVWSGYDTIPTFVNVLSIFVLSLSYKKSNSVIRAISCNTLGIYFIHQIFIHMLRDHVKSIPVFCTFGGCIAFTMVLLVISFITVSFIKKVPLIKNLLIL